MNMLPKTFFAIALGLVFSSSIFGQPYPNKPVRIIAPFPAGGPSDTIGRLVATKLGDSLGQTFIVENRPGASGVIGSAYVAKSAPDGYTLLIGATSSHISPYLLKTPSYDPNKDLMPIVNMGVMPFYLMVNSKIPAKNVNEFIALAKQRPRELTYGSPGNGSLAHLAAEIFKTQTNTDLLHIPYKGSAQVVLDLMAGHVNTTFNVTPTKSDEVRMLAVSSNKRSLALPEVPTFAQSGVPNFELSLWVGLFGPSNLPQSIVDKLNREVNKILMTPEMQQQLRTLNVEFIANTQKQFADFLATDTARWQKVIQDIGVTVD
jgi:tripartite-type tricarboxylate transporter receptor subunit TctC